MKKLSIISNQIKNNTFSYTGKGAFEAIVNKHKDQILIWFDELIPLQVQIENLNQMENVEFQKRNYTRILTKIVPEQYKEFVSINILVRDSNIIAEYYQDEYNITTLYEKLLETKYLKYPGKYDKYVEFDIFQKFIMTYRDDLISSANNIEQNDNKKIETKEYYEVEIPHTKDEQREDTKEEIEDNIEESPKVKKKDTNWTNLLLGRNR